ncbi:MAG: glycerate kinase [Dehalococcoidia bacterium]|nr:glycerate kinase [Dehalococcoidia bacterium]
MTRRILVCPQEFKGSLTAPEAARAIARGVRRADPAAEMVEAPMADGGPGTVALIHAAIGGDLVATAEGEPGPGDWPGPLAGVVDAVEASYALLPDGTAVIEAATTAGLVLVPEADRDPSRASSHGVGEQLRNALRRGARRIIVGVGGTGTNDGGAGAAQALGYRLLDVAGEPLGPGGLELDRLARIDASDVEPLLADVELRVAVDVTNRLLGPEGATAIYGPQKGVTAELAPRLEAALTRWAERCRVDLGVEIAEVDGGGGGGGIPAGLLAVMGPASGAAEATIESGATLVAETIGLPGQIAAADLVITGEGRLDAQTAYGKAVAHIAALTRHAGVPCLAVAGAVDATPDGITDAESAGEGVPFDQAMRRAPELVADAAERLVARQANAE